MVQAPAPGGLMAPMRCPGAIHQTGEGHQGRAGPLAGQAFQARIQVLPEGVGVAQLPLGPGLDQGDTPAGRLGFLTRQAVGRAVRQAEAAADATVGDLGQITGGGDGIQGRVGEDGS